MRTSTPRLRAAPRRAAEIEDLHLPEANHGAAVIARIVATKT